MQGGTTMRPRNQLNRLAAAAGVLLVPLAMLLVALLVRVDTLSAFRSGRPSALELSLDVQTAARWAIVAGLSVTAAVVTLALVAPHSDRTHP
jgi:hypothetical protein